MELAKRSAVDTIMFELKGPQSAAAQLSQLRLCACFMTLRPFFLQQDGTRDQGQNVTGRDMPHVE